MFVCSKDRLFESFLYKGISSYLFFRVICVKCIVGCLKSRSGLLAKELFEMLTEHFFFVPAIKA